MQQDDQGRPLSDDGQWVWNGTEWEPARGGGAAPSGPDTGTGGQETLISSRPDLGGSPAAASGGYGTPAGPQQPGYGVPAGGYGQPGPPGYGAPGQPFGGPGAPYGGAPYGGAPYGGYPGAPSPGSGGGGNRNKLIAGVVGALVVVAAIVVVLVLTLGGGGTKPRPLASASASSAPTPATPSASSVPSEPTPSDSPSGNGGSSTNAGGPPTGRYVCSTSSGKQIGTFTLTDVTYRTGGGGSGIWSWDRGTDAITFTGSDLSDFDGQYDSTSGDIDLVAKDKTVNLTCSQ